jgi:flagellar basal-body rod protein FlgB
MLDKLDAEFAFGRQALDVRSYRQELLSSNIANADTPGYKARDVDFSSTLAGALRKNGGSTNGTGTSNSSTLAMTQSADVTSGMTMASDYGQLQYRIPVQPSLDGNTVDLDAERVQFADNSLHFESTMTEVSGQIKSMLSAITSGS